jgi:hypothetical protein
MSPPDFFRKFCTPGFGWCGGVLGVKNRISLLSRENASLDRSARPPQEGKRAGAPGVAGLARADIFDLMD